MRKIILSFILLIIVFLPLKLNAAEITNVSLSDGGTLKTGGEFTININIGFNGLDDGTPEAKGIASILFFLDYDPSVLTYIDTYSTGFITTKIELNGMHVVTSLIDGEGNFQTCSDGVLFCGTYTASIKFRVNNVNSTTTNIKVGPTGAILNDVLAEEFDYTDGPELESYANASVTFNVINEAQKSEESKPTTTPKPVETPKQEEPKDSNIFLKSLEIKNHEITFDKNTRDYIIELGENENKLEITALAESDKSIVKITGADDLKANNNKVEIEVRAEDGNFKTYYINVVEKTKKKAVAKKENKEEYKVSKKIILILIASISGLALLGILILIRTCIKNKKLNKLLKELDK